jgi:MerR family copper efflux transcriptional regulator
VRSNVGRSKVNGMRIGELSRTSGVPRSALRYYEQAGLLRPPQRTASGYRGYDEGAVGRLAFIRAAQGVGLSLAEIREILTIRDGGRAPCRHVIELVARRQAEVRSRIRELRALDRDLTVLAEAGSRLDPAQCDPSGVCAIIPIE